MANFQFVLLLFNQKISWFLTGCNISQCPTKKKKKKNKKKNIPVRVGVSAFPVLALALSNEAYMTQKRQNGQRVLETS